ncbi:hypothetical protein QF033_002092 [Bacillus pumilus]|nr:hypothetical protein [Bacillus pumilus]
MAKKQDWLAIWRFAFCCQCFYVTDSRGHLAKI